MPKKLTQLLTGGPKYPISILVPGTTREAEDRLRTRVSRLFGKGLRGSVSTDRITVRYESWEFGSTSSFEFSGSFRERPTGVELHGLLQPRWSLRVALPIAPAVLTGLVAYIWILALNHRVPLVLIPYAIGCSAAILWVITSGLFGRAGAAQRWLLEQSIRRALGVPLPELEEMPMLGDSSRDQ